MEHTQGLFAFLDQGVSPFHSCAVACQMLEQAGYHRLEENEVWHLEPGEKYYVTRNQSSCIAFHVPASGALHMWHIMVAHGDSPSWRVKRARPESVGGAYAHVSVEGYGGTIRSTWLDRPLSVAGRLLVRTPQGLETRLVAPDRALLVIPNLCIHFNREINAGFAHNQQVDLQPVCGPAGQHLGMTLAAEAGCAPEDILGDDLVLCVRQPAVQVGLDGEWFMSPRIDDLECAYTTLQGFLETSGQLDTAADLWVMFDTEEVGSSSRQGALGTFLPDVMARLEHALGLSDEERAAARASGLLVSADNGHAVHPNHPEKSDPDNPCYMGGGVTLKFNADQSYTTSGLTEALFRTVCQRAGVPVQQFYNRADMHGGRTLGTLLGHQVSMPMLDIGLAQLAMHSAVETASVADVEYMIRASAAFYATPLKQTADGTWQIG